jgi:hypothetical protein
MITSDPRSTHRPPAQTIALLSILLGAFALAACSAAGAPVGDQPPADGRDDAGGLPDPGTGSGEDGDRVASLADQKIIKTGEISIEVPDVATALGRVRAMAIDLDGYVGGSQSGTEEEAATLTLRIPADQFDEALRRLHELDGDVVAEATREDDVTSTVVDLEARMTNLQASEAQYRALLAKAVKVEDILAVQLRLDDVRGQIEQLQAQHKELTGLADLSTLTVTLIPTALQQAAGSWDPGKTVSDAFAALVGVGQAVGNGLIWFVIVWLPALIALAVVVLVAMRLVPGLRGRFSRAPKV